MGGSAERCNHGLSFTVFPLRGGVSKFQAEIWSFRAMRVFRGLFWHGPDSPDIEIFENVRILGVRMG